MYDRNTVHDRRQIIGLQMREDRQIMICKINDRQYMTERQVVDS